MTPSAITAPFARASTATYTDVNGVVQTAAINVLRNAHYVNGVLQPPLIEGAETNLLLNSEAFDNVYWNSIINVVVIPNATTAPDGNITADKVRENTAVTNQHRFERSPSTLAAGSCCLSVFAKAAERTKIGIRIGLNTLAFVYDLSAGTVSGAAAGYTAGMTPYGNGWYRCWIAGACAAGDTIRFNLLDATGNATYTGDGVSGVYFWGADLKQTIATTPTSYISTTSAAVTRAADIDQMLAATATGYTRQLGSFLTDQFLIGMNLTPSGFASDPLDVVTAVADLTLTTKNPRTVESALAGRQLSGVSPVLVPALQRHDATRSLMTAHNATVKIGN